MTQATALTTGLKPQTIGSVRTFEWSGLRNGLPWDITGGTAQVILSDPNGNQTTLTATVGASGFSARANWVVVAPAGTWTRAWRIQDSGMVGDGTYDYSEPITFEVLSSP